MANKSCPDCHGTGMVREKNGTVHTCWKCLQDGSLDCHSKDVKDSGIKV